jgi:hypothetical protein
MSVLKCPHCLTRIEPAKPGPCSKEDCKREISADFIKACESSPIHWLVPFGFKGHGKTTLLNALLLTLKNLINVLPDVLCERLDRQTRTSLQQVESGFYGPKPASSPTDSNEPFLVKVNSLPDLGNHTLVLRDGPDIDPDRLEDLARAVPTLAESNTVWFVVSLQNLFEASGTNALPDLLASYQEAMNPLGKVLSGRTLIVVYTKADTCQGGLPEEINEYLAADPFRGIADPSNTMNELAPFSLRKEYAQAMVETGQRLEEFTYKEVPGGKAFLKAAKQAGLNPRFCVTAVRGLEPSERQPDPLRVLDPLLISLLDETPEPRQPGQGRFALLVDAAKDAGRVYADGLLMGLWKGLEEKGEVTTYYLGRTAPEAHPKQEPPTGPPRTAGVRLLGPILEQLPGKTSVLVLTNGPVHDLADFRGASHGAWRERLVLVSTNPDYRDAWPNMFHFAEGDNPEAVVKLLLSLNR